MGEDEFHELQTALEQLRACVCSQDDDEFARILSDLEVAILEIDKWPVSFFEDLEEFLKDSNFLSLASSWKLLYFINNNWEHLSEHEKERLRDVLADTFDKHWNWMGAFVTSEILGNHYADEQTLGTLARLAKTARLPERSLAPHGIGILARTTEQEALRRLAIHELQELKESESEEVRDEAQIALGKLSSS
jgi:hypothetical protein